jgi:hypothetical protein
MWSVGGLVYPEPRKAAAFQPVALGAAENWHYSSEMETESGGRMATAKQRNARKNIKKAAQAAKRKRTIAHLPKSTRTALGKQAAKVARQRRCS